MTLPPKPAKRPLGPPVLFDFRCVAIRTRADAIEASGSWEQFLDDMADLFVGSLDHVFPPADFLQTVERLVPQGDLEAHRRSMRARILERQEANLGHLIEVLDEAREPKRKPGLIARMFGRTS